MFSDLLPAFGSPLGRARLRVEPEDFAVIELPLVEPAGEGEHAWLWVRKRGQNTDWVAGQLARLAGVKPRDVSYAGLKDRHAVTEQWFSVQLPGRPDPDWNALEAEGVTVVEARRHSRKLRRGALRGNRFRLRLRDFDGDAGALMERAALLNVRGLPNYFGAQRFGRDGGNLEAARRMFADPRRRLPRQKRGLYLSAARSFLFNRVLAERVRRGDWDRCLAGDVMQLDGRSALFAAPECEPELETRLKALEVHPTGPLWGRGESLCSGECARLEADCLAAEAELREGLERAGPELDRRALRVRVEGLQVTPEGSDLWLEFDLPAGSYATVLLDQLVEWA
ncbi:tRNA pseudouridine(13) synthase TruD [Thiohalobacter thiocyanaticus]|uniref:tRNA pseudouridine synthase D n=1 Tax=Thiohalobacter thiocyanaticus TaxID=585455 RepID=A0A426QE42_9GAMM|nr:tRNA pseudouridine(13) synthase TruD [Thiohalobacter thiocyanaticus]RRQ20030.1 tRNA pseudouridine(13) synthase TruD [Thiohalobacter thiocyanaticus]